MAKCSSCGADIFWVTLEPSGSRHPVDDEPNEKGSISLTDLKAVGRSRRQMQQAVVLGKGARDRELNSGGLLYMSHFGTCPDAPSHRRPKS
jgi:hypothetical protein